MRIRRNNSDILPFDDLATEYDAWFDEEGRLIFAIEVQAFQFVTERTVSTLFQKPDKVLRMEAPREGYSPDAGFTIITGAKHGSEM